MKKIFATSILIFFIFEYSVAQQKNYHDSLLNPKELFPHFFKSSVGLQGYFPDTLKNPKELIRRINIRKEMIFSLHYEKGELKDSSLMRINYFDSLGNITKFESYDSKTQKLVGTNTFIYNVEYELIKSFFTSGKSKTISTSYFEYDSQGNQIKDDSYIDTSLTFSILKIYNNKNQETNRIVRNIRTGITGTVNFFYNKDGSIKKKISLDKNGETTSSTEFYKKKYKEEIYVENKLPRYLQSEVIYDPKDHPVQINTFYPNGQLSHIEQFTYYTDGTVFEWLWFYHDQRINAVRHYYFN